MRVTAGDNNASRSATGEFQLSPVFIPLYDRLCTGAGALAVTPSRRPRPPRR